MDEELCAVCGKPFDEHDGYHFTGRNLEMWINGEFTIRPGFQVSGAVDGVLALRKVA